MLGADRSVAAEIGDRPRDAGDAVECPRRELAFRAGMREQSQRGLVERAVVPHRVAGDLGVAGERGCRKTRPLDLARGDDAASNGCRAFAVVETNHIVERHARKLDL